MEGACQLRSRAQALNGCVGSGLGGRRGRCWVGRLVARELAAELADCPSRSRSTIQSAWLLYLRVYSIWMGRSAFPLPFPSPA